MHGLGKERGRWVISDVNIWMRTIRPPDKASSAEPLVDWLVNDQIDGARANLSAAIQTYGCISPGQPTLGEAGNSRSSGH
jgi:hypothetical protein